MNKSILIITTIIILILFCIAFIQKKDEQMQINNEVEKETNKDNEEDQSEDNVKKGIIGEFNKLIALNPNESELLDLIYLKDNQINNTTLSELLVRFLEFQFERLPIHDRMVQNENIQNELIEKYGRLHKIDNLSKLNDILLKNRLETLYKNGYLLGFNDGKFHIKINYDFFKKYNNRLSNELKDFIEIKKTIYNPYESIKIQWEYVYHNICLTENFLKNFKTSLLYNDVYSIYINNVDYILFGTDYVKIFDKSNILTSELQNQYKHIVLSKRDTVFTKLMFSYYNDLVDNNFILSKSINNKRNEIFSILKKEYKRSN